jgi:Heterokaryon incompatibility protein (HET)
VQSFGHVSVDGPFCVTCKDFLGMEEWRNGDHEGSIEAFEKKYSRTFQDVRKSAQQPCRICRILLLELERLVGPVEKAVGCYDGDYHVDVDYWIHSTLPHWHLRVFLSVSPLNSLGVYHFHLWGERIEQLESSYFSHFRSDPPPNTKSPGTLLLARKWLRNCLENHAKCDGNRDVTWIPPRLLDLRRRHVRLKCFPEGARSQEHYAALSYCWGSNPSILTLTTDKLNELQEGITTSDFPLVIRQAVEACRMLTINYLWVDSLCILQSGPGSTKDWLRHTKLMRLVYSNAVLTICAARASEPGEGMFAERDPSAITAPKIMHSGRELTFIEEWMFRQGRQSMPVATRGWILQEGLMSPRTLSFEKDQVFWACEEMPNACEVFTTGPPCAIDEVMIPFNLPDTITEKEGHRIWDDIIKDYTRRSLTTPDKDKFVALSAIAGRMAQLLDDQYVAGMFLRSLPMSLLWTIDRKIVSKPGGTYRAPSWSWACFDGRIYPHSTMYNPELLGPPSILDVHLEHVDKENPFGQLSFASLKLRLVVAPAVFPNMSEETYQTYLKEGRFDQHSCTINGIPMTGNEPGNVEICFDPFLDKAVTARTEMLLALIYKIHLGMAVFGLIIVPEGSAPVSPTRDPRPHVRVGTWRVNGTNTVERMFSIPGCYWQSIILK